MENNEFDTMATEPPPSPEQLTELIQALDQASQMARQLSTGVSNSDHHRLILASLHSAHLSLSSFLSSHHHSPTDNSISSAAGDDPMTDGEGEEEQESKDSSMERMEEKMRDSLYIQKKRPKRPLSPSSAAVAEQQGLEERESVTAAADFDPDGSRLRNLDLVYQFHG
uniref:Uncharacterized protein n=1 Tax=Opuntia streptacantha TaxID=393608 RepID=A0A7C8YR63_OPUST